MLHSGPVLYQVSQPTAGHQKVIWPELLGLCRTAKREHAVLGHTRGTYMFSAPCCHPGAPYCCPAGPCACQHNNSRWELALKLLLQQQATSQACSASAGVPTSYVAVGGGAAASIRFEASLLALLATLLSHIAQNGQLRQLRKSALDGHCYCRKQLYVGSKNMVA